MQNKAFDKIKQAWEENPLQVIMIATGAAIAVAKLMDASTARVNAKAWAKEVDRRTYMKRH